MATYSWKRWFIGRVNPWGYAYLEGGIAYQRIVYEAAHGPIPEGFHVHHRNGDKLDNRIENLEAMSPSDHSRLHGGHRKVDGRWVRRCPLCGEEKDFDRDFRTLPCGDKKKRECRECRPDPRPGPRPGHRLVRLAPRRPGSNDPLPGFEGVCQELWKRTKIEREQRKALAMAKDASRVREEYRARRPEEEDTMVFQGGSARGRKLVGDAGLAKYLGISRPTVSALARAGKITPDLLIPRTTDDGFIRKYDPERVWREFQKTATQRKDLPTPQPLTDEGVELVAEQTGPDRFRVVAPSEEGEDGEA